MALRSYPFLFLPTWAFQGSSPSRLAEKQGGSSAFELLSCVEVQFDSLETFRCSEDPFGNTKK